MHSVCLTSQDLPNARLLFLDGKLVWRDLAAATDQQAADVLKVIEKNKHHLQWFLPPLKNQLLSIAPTDLTRPTRDIIGRST